MKVPSFSRRLPLAGAALCIATAASAQIQGGIADPPDLDLTATLSAQRVDGLEAPGTTSRTRTRATDPGARLQLRLLRSAILNPGKGGPGVAGFDTVWHRGYVDLANPPPEGEDHRYAAPLIRAVPGETVRIDLHNHLLPYDDLPIEQRPSYDDIADRYDTLMPPDECNHTPQTMNVPDLLKCFNVTNMHFHGSWVSPVGNSDNVLRELHPAADRVYEYEYNIPNDHPAGTFWYHPHVHGATAIQVGSGMAGPLVIEGDRWPGTLPDGRLRSGDIDVLLRKADGSPIPDRLFLFQQIQYACKTLADGTPKPAAPAGTPNPQVWAGWACAEGELGSIDGYGILGGANWANSGHFTTVNGAVAAVLGADDPGSGQPPRPVVAGQPERWRFIHGGFGDSIKVQIFRRQSDTPDRPGEPTVFESAAADQQDAVIRRECRIDDEPVAMFEIAADGLTRPSILRTDNRPLHPGYRSDVLVSFDEPGEYCVVDVPLAQAQSVEGSVVDRRLLFTVRVQEPEGDIAPAETAILDMLVNAAIIAADQSSSERLAIVRDLFDGLKLTRFSPHGSLADAEIDNYRYIRFNLLNAQQVGVPDAPQGAGIGYGFVSAEDATDEPPVFDDRRFSTRPEDAINLTLGDVDEWVLTANAPVGHPFHIHINPFEVMAVNRTVTRDGVEEVIDLTEVESYVDESGQTVLSQYYGMKGVFKDTIFTEVGVEVVLRSHYERYIGRFVLHCHILSHEDAGMMRIVEIHDPGRLTETGVLESAHAGHN
ncbi:multicopper oxidase domain-containing protein [Paracoccus sp. S3-43]|uniref:multicopper oxidase family protein n=1 Tax=Paracoccus sp. S3-43 TaxID=3030011 RepID=UPI0023B0D9FB|nr:multicopper oxidase domain-containing protein [Paracoccus sp. S3-43]WEF24881.1 multicopper oxidase domain-containing protein [Paracoccus sp. S3-43]